MTAPMLFGMPQLDPILPEFLEAYPEVTVNLHLSDAQKDMIANPAQCAATIAGQGAGRFPCRAPGRPGLGRFRW